MKTCVNGHPIPRGEDYYQQVTGWVANGKRDSLTLRKDVEPWRFACRRCVRNWQHGIDDNQVTML